MMAIDVGEKDVLNMTSWGRKIRCAIPNRISQKKERNKIIAKNT